MFIKSYFSHHLHQCQWIHDTSMYFLYKKQISYSALTIWIVRIVFGNQKMNEYEYQIPLSGPNYSNSQIVWIIHSNTARDFMDCSCVCLGLLWLHHQSSSAFLQRLLNKDTFDKFKFLANANIRWKFTFLYL